MAEELKQTHVDRPQRLMNEGWAILNDYILLAGRGRFKMGFFAKRRLKKAVKLFDELLKIVPDHFAAKWALGKSYQVLGDHNCSLKWFEEAWGLEKANADICRETALAAMACGQFLKALDFCDKAIALNRDDAGLYCNKALVMMFLKRDADAIEAVTHSLRLCPSDQTSLNVRAVLHSIIDGRRSRPVSVQDI